MLLLFGEGDMCAYGDDGLGGAFDDDLAGHGAFGVEYHCAVAFFPDVLVHVIAHLLHGVLDAAHEQVVTLLDVLSQFPVGMLDDHVGQVRADAFVQQDGAAVVLQESARELADVCDGHIVLDVHNGGSSS